MRRCVPLVLRSSVSWNLILLATPWVSEITKKSQGACLGSYGSAEPVQYCVKAINPGWSEMHGPEYCYDGFPSCSFHWIMAFCIYLNLIGDGYSNGFHFHAIVAYCVMRIPFLTLFPSHKLSTNFTKMSREK